MRLNNFMNSYTLQISEPGDTNSDLVLKPVLFPNLCWASLIAQLVKNLPSMKETPVQFLGWEDPLEKGKATHSSILAWTIPWTV